MLRNILGRPYVQNREHDFFNDGNMMESLRKKSKLILDLMCEFANQTHTSKTFCGQYILLTQPMVRTNTDPCGGFIFISLRIT